MNLPPRVFLLGIGGTAMGNLALGLARRGVQVAGSDRGVYPPMSELLAAAGIPVHPPGKTAVLAEWEDALFVVGNALSRGAPEVEWLLGRPQVAFVSLPAFLGRWMLAGGCNLVVAGTHGKSTTTGAAVHLLGRIGVAGAGHLVGGALADGSPALVIPEVEGAPCVVEGDEYDGAFFDKRPKFVHYRPQVLALTHLEFDHGDIYRDLEDVRRAFRQVLALVPPGGTVLANGDDPELRRLLPVPWSATVTVGCGDDNDWILRREPRPDGQELVLLPGSGAATGTTLRVRTSLWGEANARNLALAVLGCRSLLPESFPAGGAIDLGGYQGLRRRQEVLADTGEIVLVEDFGHHPSAFRETLRALRERFPGRRVHAFVEPRSNTLVTRRFEAELATVLAEADAITLAPLHREERVPAGERLNREGLLGALLAAGVDAAGADTAGALTDRFRGAVEETGPPRVVVVFSNGGFHGLLPEWRARLAGRG